MKEKTMATMFLDGLAKFEEKTKFRFKRDGEWKEMTGSQAGRLARAIAAGLYARGLQRGDRVCIMSSTRVEWTLADVACTAGGFVSVPVYHSSLPDSVKYIMGNSGAKAVFVEDEMQLMKVDVVKESLDELKAIITLTPVPKERLEDTGAISLNELQKEGERELLGKSGFIDDIASSISPDEDFTIIYTSGTTGPPKGVLTTHAHYQFITRSAIETTDMSIGETILHFLPFAHSLGRLEEFIAFEAGLVSAYAESMDLVGEGMEEMKPHFMFSVPRLYEKFYDRIKAMVAQSPPIRQKIFSFAEETGSQVSKLKQESKEIPFFLSMKYEISKKLVFNKIKEKIGGRLRFFISGGAPLAREIAEFFHSMDVMILEGYGLTESSTVASVNRVDNFKFGTVGLPLPGVSIKIEDDGEILIGGKNIFKEYFNDPEATRLAKTEDGWLKTGDIGEIDGDGFLKITDRKKDIIVTAGGKNIPPANIENLLKTDRYISHAFVYGDRKKYLTAIITLVNEEVEGWAKEKGYVFNTFEDLAGSDEVSALIGSRIEEINSGLPSFETIKKFIVIPQDFAQETGELTPTLKIKRKVVVARYGQMLDDLYGRDNG